MYGEAEEADEEAFVSLDLQRKGLFHFPLELIEHEIQSTKRPLRHIWLDNNAIGEIPPQVALC